MIASENQSQAKPNKGICPEACHFCHGIGMASPITELWEANPHSSCKNWPSLDSEALTRVSKDSQEWHLPSKFLRGVVWKRLIEKLPEYSKLILLVGDSHFDSTTLKQISKKFPVEIWIIPNRKFDTVSMLRKIPEELLNRIYFYCPLYERTSDTFLTSQELSRLFIEISTRFPELKIQSPKKRDLFNPSLAIEDLKCEEEILFDSSKDRAADVSVVIPSYNNQEYVCKVVKNLAQQVVAGISFEVTVIDDGSSDGTSNSLVDNARQGLLPDRFRLIRFPRRNGRKMGDFQFRAGLARRLGVKYSKGHIFAFLDSDMLVPSDYIQSLYENHIHHNYDVVQIQRLYLKEKISKSLQFYSSINRSKEVFHPDAGYWKSFFSDLRPWDEIPHRWKYVCTYGLSVKAEKYLEVGGFRTVFNSYGFEDTDLGYRLAKSGARFFKSPLEAYHLWHEPSKSEFGNLPWRRQRLLGRSANIFFRHNLDLEVFEELSSLLVENRSWKNRFRFGKKH